MSSLPIILFLWQFHFPRARLSRVIIATHAQRFFLSRISFTIMVRDAVVILSVMAKSLFTVNFAALLYLYICLVVGERPEEASEAISSAQTLDAGQALWEICESRVSNSIQVRGVELLAALIQAPRPSPGPHKLRECLPLIVLLRNRLKYALTGDEVKRIVKQRLIKVDGKIRTDPTFPAGFMGKSEQKRICWAESSAMMLCFNC